MDRWLRGRTEQGASVPRAALGQSGKPRRGPHLGRPPASSSCCRSGDCGPDHCARTCQPDQGAWVGSAARPRRAPAVGSAAARRGARGGAFAERPLRSQHTPAAPSGRPPAIWRAPTCCRARGTRARQGPLRCGARGRVAGAPRLQRKGAAGGTLGLRSYRHCREVVPPAPAAGARLQQERERCQHQRQRDQELGSPARQERRRDPRALHRRSRGCPRRASPARHHHRAAKAPPRRSAPLPAPLRRVPLSTRTLSPAAHRTGAVRAPWQSERAVRSAHQAAPAALSVLPCRNPLQAPSKLWTPKYSPCCQPCGTVREQGPAMFARRLAQVLGAKLAQRAGRAGWAGLVVEGAAQRQACRSYATDYRCGC